VKKFIGVDLHKQLIVVCAVNQARQVVARQHFRCRDGGRIVAWFAEQGPFEMVVEATASYEWFVALVEPHAERVVLAHPAKLRVIAESTRKSDKLDARVLAEFLALGGSCALPELFEAAGLKFDFSEKTLRPLIEAVMEEIDRP
jgi:transposase